MSNLVFPLPARTIRARYVSKSGSDTSGDGSIGNPYLTVQTALAAITDASGSNLYTIFIGPGSYTMGASQVLSPFVSYQGSGKGVTSLQPSSGGFSIPLNLNTTAALVEFSDIQLPSNVTITRTAGGTSVFNEIHFTNCRLFGAISYTGTGDIRDVGGFSTNGDDLYMRDCEGLFATVTTAGTVGHIQGCFLGNVTHSDTGVDASGQGFVMNLNNNRIGNFAISGAALANLFNTRNSRYTLNGTSVAISSDVSSFSNNLTLNSSATEAQITITNQANAFNKITGTSASPSLISAGTAITTTSNILMQKQYVAGNGGAVTMSASPQIAAGNKEGQIRFLIGRHATNTVTVSDGTGLSLGAATRVLGLNSVLGLTWDASAAVWVELFFKA
ncbi:MAG TPA: hypothetical protein VMZ26_17485 [Pyrinomonadaceae bacterium]|nr:hypothetical protein [Pyrinomonadaceae bacterium]